VLTIQRLLVPAFVPANYPVKVSKLKLTKVHNRTYLKCIRPCIYESVPNSMSTIPHPLPCPGPLWTPLVQQVAGGDPEAIQALSAFLAGLKGYFCKHIGADDAEDMFHDLIVVLIKEIQKGSLEYPERLPGYAHAIAQRQIAAQIRLRIQSRRACNVDDVKLPDQAANAETSLARKELRAIAQRVLRSMPVQQRAVLIRFYIQEQRPRDSRSARDYTDSIRVVKSAPKRASRNSAGRRWNVSQCALSRAARWLYFCRSCVALLEMHAQTD